MTAALRQVSGVRSVERVAGLMEMRVIRDGTKLADSELTTAISAVGYRAAVVPTRIAQLSVANLDCNGCEGKARTALYGIKGTKIAAVSKSRRQAIVQYDTRHTSGTKLAAALTQAGFPARGS